VYQLLSARGLQLGADEKDPYVRGMLALCRNGGGDHLLDRLLVAGIVEARGCERLGLLAEALDPGPLREFYGDLTRAESRHHALFVQLARRCFAEDAVRERLDALLDAEAAMIARLPYRAAVH